MSIKICLHCKTPTHRYVRGLCSVCYHRAEIRAHYPRLTTRRSVNDPEPTKEQLDALVAAQLPTMVQKKPRLPDRVPPSKRQMNGGKQ